MKNYMYHMQKELILRDYSINTRKAYCWYLQRYLNFCDCNKSLNRTDKIKAFLAVWNGSEPAKRIALSALKFFYKYVVRIPIECFVVKMKNRKRLPRVLSPQQVTTVLECIKNGKHRLMIALMFGAGLRVSEVVGIKIKDVQIDRAALDIKNSKNKTDRVTILPKVLIEPLTIYMHQKKADDYLFSSNMKPQYSIRTVQTIFKRALIKSGIPVDAGSHILRHSFATNLLENGINILIIKDLLGHKSVKTTMIYTHVSDNKRKDVTSPLTAFS